MARSIEQFLIVRSDGSCRVVVRKPANLHWNELAYRLVINVPDGWGRIAGTITVNLPEATIVEANTFTYDVPLISERTIQE